MFDGTRNVGERDVLIRDGKISAMGASIATPTDATVVDATGEILLPGLIDSHTHAYGDALQQALVFGVTTELDMFTDPHFAASMRAEQKKGNVADRADLYSAGYLATAPKGHGTEYGITVPTITSPDSAQAWVDARIAEGSDYVKIIIDDGSTYGIHIPTLSEPIVAALAKAAHKRGKLAVAHIGSLADARMAIGAGVDGLEHLFIDHAPDPEFGRFVASHHAFVTPTLTVLKSIAETSGVADLARDPRFAPYISGASRQTINATFPKRQGSNTRYAFAQATVKQQLAAHVPILAGTDAGNPGTGHGIALHREIELLVQAGLTPSQALAAATSVPARTFSLNDRGTIAIGKRADLILVRGDPTSDITATRDIVGIWKGGVKVTRTPIASLVATTSNPSVVGMISNFDDGTTKASMGLGWIVSTDQLAGGQSTAAMKVVDGGANGTAKSLETTGTVAPGLPYAWAGPMFMPGSKAMEPTNLSAAKSLHFWAKGDGKTYHVMVFSQSMGYTPLSVEFVAGSDWKEYTFPFSAFQGIDGHDIMGIAFTAGPTPGPFTLQIDEVSFK
ncbi:MAG: CIA30 family protein [Gemmatimonadales bacterium]